MLTPKNVRRGVVVVTIVAIAGMIVSSIADDDGAAVTFGIILAIAALGLILVSAVAPTGSTDEPTFDEELAVRVERQIGLLAADGADEAAVRRVVRDAVRLGRSAGPERADR